MREYMRKNLANGQVDLEKVQAGVRPAFRLRLPDSSRLPEGQGLVAPLVADAPFPSRVAEV